MKWQDAVFAVGSVVFAVSLIPILLDDKSVVPLTTSAVTAGFLYLYAITFHSLKLRFSAITAVLNAIAWTLVAVLRHG